MATYSFEALGFNPAPGDPDAVMSLARECARAGRDLQDGAAQLAGLGDPGIWEGEAAERFKDRAQRVRADLEVSGGACETVASTLIGYADTLRDAQAQAHRAANDAADARARAQRFATDVQRLTAALTTIGPDGDGMADLFEGLQVAQRQRDWAEEDYRTAMQRASAVREWVEEVGATAARTISGIEAPYHRPRRNLVQRATGWVADTAENAGSALNRFVDAHTDVLREISSGLKAVSAGAGLLSFVPVLTPIMAPIATATAGTALALDVTLVATGHGNWQQVAVDGALMALPGAGRLASRTAMGRQAGLAVTRYASEVATSAAFTRATRPATVATLRTRSLRPNQFNGASRGPHLELHPRLQRALDRVPPTAQSQFHGKCAEVRAIDQALKRGANLKDAVLRTRRVRLPGHHLHGAPHDPCPSCKNVLDRLKINYME